MKENCHSKLFTICKLLKQHVLTYPPLSKCGKLFGNLFGFKELPSVDLFSKKPYAFLLDYKSALIKREWISCDDMSWLTQIIMERIKWVWLTDSQAAKQSHHQSLLTYLLTHSLTHSLSHSLTHSVNQSINQSINRSINQWIQKYVTHIKYHICDRREIDRLLCVCIVENTMITFKYIPSDSILLQATEIYLFYATLLNQKNYQVYILFTKLALFLPQSWDLLEKLPLVLSVYFFVLFYQTPTFRSLLCPAVCTCSLLADD